MFGANLVIPAEICDDLLCGQGKVYGQTDRRADGQNEATLWPERPRGKNGKTQDHMLRVASLNILWPLLGVFKKITKVFLADLINHFHKFQELIMSLLLV